MKIMTNQCGAFDHGSIRFLFLKSEITLSFSFDKWALAIGCATLHDYCSNNEGTERIYSYIDFLCFSITFM